MINKMVLITNISCVFSYLNFNSYEHDGCFINGIPTFNLESIKKVQVRETIGR